MRPLAPVSSRTNALSNIFNPLTLPLIAWGSDFRLAVTVSAGEAEPGQIALLVWRQAVEPFDEQSEIKQII